MTESGVVAEPTAEPGNGHESHGLQPDLAHKIIEQVNYYFGDINLPRDKFLQDEIKKDNGWVTLETMLKFNRLKQLCSDVEKLAKVLQESHIVDVSDDNQKIRRNPEIPLPENSLEYWQEIKNRTVYLKGFPLDTKLDEIMAFMKPYGPVKNVLMRRVKGEKTFKGSVFITFEDKETAQKFAQNEEVKDYNGQELVKLMQMDYWTKKNKENKERKEAARSLKHSKNKEVQEESKKSAHMPTFVKGIILQIEGLSKEKIEGEKFKETIGSLKEFFKPHGEVGYIAQVEDTNKINIRFIAIEENFASKAWDSAVKAAEDEKVIFDGAVLQAKVLDGEEEQRYWADFTKGKLAKIERIGAKRGGRQGKRGGRGGKRHGNEDKPKGDINQRKHTIFKDSDEEGEANDPPTKKLKEENLFIVS